jgi:cation diffusion facilitator family transporter
VEAESRRAVVAAFLANLGIACSKLVAFVFTGAASMLAEAIHSFADTGNQGLLMIGARGAQRPPDAQHPFGYGARRYFWSFVVAMVLFSVGGLFAIYEGVEKLRHPHHLDAVGWAIAVLLVGAALESLSLRTALRQSRGARRGRSIFVFVRETKVPELAIVLLEDIGALCGLAFALLGVVLAEVLHAPRWDAAGSLAIGVLLVVIAIVLAVEMASLLIGESAEPATVETIRAILGAHGGVRRVIALRTQHIGPEHLVVNAKLEFDPSLRAPEVAAVVNELEVDLRAAVPEARTVFVEPDVYREHG